jgi:hypothetical protein
MFEVVWLVGCMFIFVVYAGRSARMHARLQCCAAKTVASIVGMQDKRHCLTKWHSDCATPKASGILQPDHVFLAVQSGQPRQAGMSGFPCVCFGGGGCFVQGLSDHFSRWSMTCLQKGRYSWTCLQNDPAIHLWLDGGLLTMAWLRV